MMYLLVADQSIRDALLAYLEERGIRAVFHYVPLHTSLMGELLGYRPGDLPVTEEVSSRLLRLPLYYEMTQAAQHRVVRAVKAFFATSKVVQGRCCRAEPWHESSGLLE
jgi:dTDP-4-amino-4,6-dideoxygalactose transaminase